MQGPPPTHREAQHEIFLSDPGRVGLDRQKVLSLELSDEAIGAIADRVSECLRERRSWGDIEAVADHLGVSVKRVRQLRERGLPARKLPDKAGTLSKRLWFDLYEVDEWIAREGVRV